MQVQIGLDSVEVRFNRAREVAIRLQARADQAREAGKSASETIAAGVLKALQAKRGDAKMTHDPDYVGATVGEELKSDGIVAVLFVIIGIMIYIGIRFEWRSRKDRSATRSSGDSRKAQNST